MTEAPSYNELVRALAFCIGELDNAKHEEGFTPATVAGEAQLASARALLLRAQGSPEPKRAKANTCEHVWVVTFGGSEAREACALCGETRL